MLRIFFLGGGRWPSPGLSDEQGTAVEFALRMVPESLHDGISLAILAGLGNDGPPWSDAEVMASITVSLIRCSGLEIPDTLFGTSIGLKADANQIHVAKSGLFGSTGMKAN